MELNLPYDTETEDTILGGVINNPLEYDSVSKYITNSGVFYQNKEQLLWYKITEMKRANQHIDMLTICSALNDKDTKKGLTSYYITKCTSNSPAKGMCEYYANQIYEKYLLRKIIVHSEEIKEKAKGNTKDVYQSISEAHSLYGELLDIRPSKVQDIEDVISDTLISIENQTSKLIKTGYDNLDKYSGGLTRGEITIIGGRPGHGKTTLMLNVLKSLIDQGLNVMLFNREMSNTEMIKKMCVLENNELLYSDVRRNKFDSKSEVLMELQMENLKKKYKNLKMYDHIRSLSDTMSEIAKHKPDVIIDDYIQLIQADGSNEGRRFEIEKIMQEYKWICKSENASAFLLSQLNREMDRRINPEPRMSDYSESGVIEQTAETAMFVFYGYNFDSSAYDKYESKLISAKARYGNVGSYMVGFNGNKCKFYKSRELAFNDTKDRENT